MFSKENKLISHKLTEVIVLTNTKTLTEKMFGAYLRRLIAKMKLKQAAGHQDYVSSLCAELANVVKYKKNRKCI